MLVFFVLHHITNKYLHDHKLLLLEQKQGKMLVKVDKTLNNFNFQFLLPKATHDGSPVIEEKLCAEKSTENFLLVLFF